MMKTFLNATLIVLVMSVGASAQGRSFGPNLSVRVDLFRPSGFEAIVERVRSLDTMTYRVGFGLTPGEFYRLSQDCLRLGTRDDFKRLLMDVAPLVRLMGLICLANSVDVNELAGTAAVMYVDKAVVTYTNGCILRQKATAGELARLIVDGQFVLIRERAGRQ